MDDIPGAANGAEDAAGHLDGRDRRRSARCLNGQAGVGDGEALVAGIVRTGRRPVTAQAASGGWALRRADRVMNELSPKYPPRVRRS